MVKKPEASKVKVKVKFVIEGEYELEYGRTLKDAVEDLSEAIENLRGAAAVTRAYIEIPDGVNKLDLA